MILLYPETLFLITIVVFLFKKQCFLIQKDYLEVSNTVSSHKIYLL